MMISVNDKRITLKNEYLYRVIDIEQGPVTLAYKIRPNGNERGEVWYPVFSFEANLPFEASVTINGQYFEAGAIEPLHEDWTRKGAFRVKEVKQEYTNLGERLKLICNGIIGESKKVELCIVYELADKSPLLTKSIHIKNISDEALIIDNVTVDILRFINERNDLKVFTDYYWNTEKEDSYYKPFIRMEFPDNILMKLEPNESFETFKCYEVAASGDLEESAVVLHRIYKEIAPWITDTYIKQVVNSCSSFDELMKCADAAADNGIEAVELFVGQLFTNTGDYIPRPDLFPNGYEDMKNLVNYFHKKNIKVLPYCSTTIAWPGSEVMEKHIDWQYLGPDGIRYNPYGLGNMCYQSPWGEYIKEKLFYLIDEIGFDGLGLDGPYHGLPCLDKNHKHKNTETVRYMNWAWEKEFFGEVVKKNKYITAPQEMEGLFLGINQRPGGYREEDQNEFGDMPLVVQCRARLYDARYKDPACATWGTCSIEDSHGHNIGASEENPATYDHGVGSIFGYGHSGVIFAKNLYIGEKTKQIYRKWIDFYKKYRDTLAGEMIHLIRPTGIYPDAVMHVSIKAPVPAVLVIFNPLEKKANVALSLPLRYAGFKEGDTAMIESLGECKVDSRGCCTVNIDLKSFEIKTIEISKLK